METGKNTYLTPDFIEKEGDQFTLSIRLLSDGFCVFVHLKHNQTLCFSDVVQADESDLDLVLSQYLNTQSFLQRRFENCQVFVNTASFWIPKHVENKDELNALASLQIPFNAEQEQLLVNQHPQWKAQHVFVMPKAVYTMLNQHFSGKSIDFLYSDYHLFQMDYSALANKRKLILNQELDGFELWFLNSNTDLQFHKQFKIKSKDEFEFVFFHLLKTLQFNFSFDYLYCFPSVSDEFIDQIKAAFAHIERLSNNNDVEIEMLSKSINQLAQSCSKPNFSSQNLR
ncbi:MAG: DUF3822 family protein [Flavobacteriales bacterium]